MSEAKTIADLKRKRGYSRAALTRVESFVSQSCDKLSDQDAVVQLELLERCYNEFKTLDENLQDFDLSFSEIDEFERRYAKIRAKLLSIVNIKSPAITKLQSTLNDTMERLSQQQNDFFLSFQNQSINNGSRSEVNQDLKLPRINIPTFNGNYSDFPSFRDIYESSIHNNTKLSDVHKLQLLKSFLTDKAANLVKNMNITTSNYNEVWEKVCKRFEKKTPIITSLIKQFMEMPAANDSVDSQRKIADTCDQVVRGLKVLGNSAELRDPWLIYIVLNKLTVETREQWAMKTVNTEFPSFQELLAFLETKCSALENCDIGKKSSSQNKTLKSHVANTSLSTTEKIKSLKTSLKCPKCQESHHLSNCLQFKSLPIDERMDYVSSNRLCFNCLFLGHSSKLCKSNRRCFICDRKHHTSLHGNSSTNTIHSPRAQSSETSEVSIQSTISIFSNPILPTALIKVSDKYGILHLCRILLDSGSTCSLISEACMNKLKLPRSNARFPVKGISSKNSITRGYTELKIMPHFSNSFEMKIKAFILESLPSDIPRTDRELISVWHQLRGKTLADSDKFIGDIDIILGVGSFLKILKEGQIVGPDELFAQNTALGWIIGGGNLYIPEQTSLNLQLDFNVDHFLQKFWEIEELQQEIIMSPTEMLCETQFREAHSRSSNGKFIVKLPFKADFQELGNSLNQAMSRFMSIERKLDRNEALKNEYSNFMNEYINLGHMVEISKEEHSFPHHKHFYLPHHPVVKQTSLTTKVRVVFDGSAKTTSGVSLNDNLLIGPTVQPDLLAIIMNFRLHRIAITSDIEKMYRQVEVCHDDANFQRIVWRNDKNMALKHYKLVTVTYGTSSAPFQATRCLRELANLNVDKFPNASRAIAEHFYVDDLLSGSSSVDATITLCKDIMKILNSAGFPLRKWASNSIEVLKALPGNNSENFLIDVLKSTDHKILGLYWDPKADVLKFKIDLQTFRNNSQTKRELLSDSSRLFDPLGWLTPATVSIKILFQQVWIHHLDWDDVVPDAVAEKWNKIKNNLNVLENIKINRCLSYSDSSKIEIHGFSDASQNAYAAVVYCRIEDEFGNIHVNLLTSKSRVAPIKQISIPRLELCAAHLLARLIDTVIKNLKWFNYDCYAWTDSQIVLHWLNDHPSKWKTFVANRTSQIMTLLPKLKWNHVSTANNPADCSSRGILPQDLVNHGIWWHGPAWLSQAKQFWPVTSNMNFHTQSENLEEKLIKVNHVLISNDCVQNLFDKVSQYSKLRRVLAYVMKFILKLKLKIQKFTPSIETYLTTSELKKADTLCNKWAQETEFHQDIKDLAAGRNVSKGKLLALTPFLDAEGVLRVGGRLNNSQCSYSVKHPVILPYSCKLSKMILNHIHNLYQHPGPSLLSHLSRQSYWIINVRKLSRKVINECIICCRLSANIKPQLMGHLPPERVTPTKPFSNTSLDYAGPIQILSRKGRGAKHIKAYIAVFVCQCVKAVHLEVVSDLSSDAFLAALKRFVSRRGLPHKITSDNGTNFIGAKRKLTEDQQELMSALKHSGVQDYAIQTGIEWNFTPPSAPHFNGLSEAAVRSVKHHLIRSIGQSFFTFEELSTFLCQTEAILNSRPLTPMSEDIEDINILTPAHFLTTGPLLALPEVSYENISDNRLNRWQEIKKRVDSFWSRYKKEYINNLQAKTKWKTKETNLQPGDMVLIKEHSPPLSWPLGRIIDVHVGTDGLVRVANVKTATTTLKRPIVKLIKLPIENNFSTVEVKN